MFLLVVAANKNSKIIFEFQSFQAHLLHIGGRYIFYVSMTKNYAKEGVQDPMPKKWIQQFEQKLETSQKIEYKKVMISLERGKQALSNELIFI